MINVTLVFPRFKYPSGDFSLGLAYISAYLKEKVKDVNVSMIDTTFNPSMDYVNDILKKSKPAVVGIYVGTLMYVDAMKVAELAKFHSAFVVAGGPHPTILPHTVINEHCIDAVCIGEGEETFAELVMEVVGDRKFSRVDGIWYKENGVVVKNPARKYTNDLDSLPFPDVGMFDVENYIKNFIQMDSYSPNLRGISTIISRGCPYTCSYCQPTLSKVFGKKFRLRSPMNVIQELKILKKEYNLDVFYFQDDTLTARKDWVLEFSELAITECLDMHWACNTRADIINADMMEKMKGAGLVKLKVGIESIPDRIRNGIYSKGISVSQINQFIKTADGLGIQVTGFFMLGAPSETKSEILETINFATTSALKEANFSVTVPLPETDLYELSKEKGWSLPEDFSDYDYYHASRPFITADDMSAKKLELYKKYAYLSFYLHPKRIFHTLKIVFGFNNFKKTIQKLKRF